MNYIGLKNTNYQVLLACELEINGKFDGADIGNWF